MDTPVTRPRFLNLLRIKMPVGAVTSIAHRLTGVLLFLMIPVLVYGLDLSLQGPEQFERVRGLFSSPYVRFSGVFVVWAIVHHFLAGIRFLLLDLQVGMHKSQARTSAWIVNAGSLTVVLVYLVSLL